MKNVCIKDPDSTNYDNKKLNLSILFTQNGLCFSIKSVDDNKCLVLYSTIFSSRRKSLAETETFLKSENIVSKDYNSVSIVIVDPRQTIVPSALFSPGAEKKLWKLNFEPNVTDIICYSFLEKSDNYIIYPINKGLRTIIDRFFPVNKTFPSSYSFIEKHFTRNKLFENQNNERMFIQIFENYFEMLVLNKSGIRLFNVFQYSTSNDILYYIISVFDRLKLIQTETEVIFSGFVESDDHLIINLKKFISQLGFESQSNEFNYFYRFQEIAPHYYYNFLNL
ncbi:MAG TPA: DUF3822 family protein [Bacteroidales bacterium]|nr:DUF3822 family protein [Bacteroidales bacterium]